MKKITKREVLFFFAGMAAMLIIESIYNWDNTVKAIKDGWTEGHARAVQERVK